MDAVAKAGGTFTCPGCMEQVREFGSMSSIAPPGASRLAYVFFECAPCTDRAQQMPADKRVWQLGKIEKKLARNPDAYSAVCVRSSAVAVQMVADFETSGMETRSPVAALAAGMMGPARRAEAVKNATAQADKDDAAWFDTNLHRYYRLRPVAAGEVDGVSIGYVPEAVIVIQIEPGKRSKALLSAAALAWPDEDDFLEGALSAGTEQPMPIGNGQKMAGWRAWQSLQSSGSI
jgi:hypothetical protein